MLFLASCHPATERTHSRLLRIALILAHLMPVWAILRTSLVHAAEVMPATTKAPLYIHVLDEGDFTIRSANLSSSGVPMPSVLVGDGPNAQPLDRLPTPMIHLNADTRRFLTRLSGGLASPRPPIVRPAQQMGGWMNDYYATSFDGEFPDRGRNCTWEQVRFPYQSYGWGKGTDRSASGSHALWPAGAWMIETVGVPLLPGLNYPNNLVSELLCEMRGMENADNLLVEFDLWHELADPGDSVAVLLFAGDYTVRGEPVYRGLTWTGTEEGATIHDWTTVRFYYPHLKGSDVVRIKLRFASDDGGSAAGPWLDNLRIERYDQPTASNDCATLDPTLVVNGTPGNIPVSKGLILPPYAEDDLAARVVRLREAGVQWVRLEFAIAPEVAGAARLLALPPDNLGPGDIGNHIDLKHYDELVDALCAAGISVLGLIDYQTVLSQSWREGGAISDRYLATFTAVAEQLARYYGDRIGTWEVWNEPDFEGTRLLPADYARLLTATYASIKAAQPDAAVLFGGLGSADYAALDYLQRVYAHLSVPSPFDIFAIHPYPSVEYDRNDLKLNPGDYLLRDEVGAPTILHKFLEELKRHGDQNKEVWVTELGWNSAIDSTLSANCPAINEQLVSQEKQAAYLHASLNILFRQTAWDWLKPGSALLNSTPAVTKVFWFQYRDTGILLDCNRARRRAAPGAASVQGQTVEGQTVEGQTVEVVDWWYGLFDGNFQPKPSHIAFRCYPRAFTLAGCIQETFLPLIGAP